MKKKLAEILKFKDKASKQAFIKNEIIFLPVTIKEEWAQQKTDYLAMNEKYLIEEVDSFYEKDFVINKVKPTHYPQSTASHYFNTFLYHSYMKLNPEQTVEYLKISNEIGEYIMNLSLQPNSEHRWDDEQFNQLWRYDINIYNLYTNAILSKQKPNISLLNSNVQQLIENYLSYYSTFFEDVIQSDFIVLIWQLIFVGEYQLAKNYLNKMPKHKEIADFYPWTQQLLVSLTNEKMDISALTQHFDICFNVIRHPKWGIHSEDLAIKTSKINFEIVKNIDYVRFLFALMRWRVILNQTELQDWEEVLSQVND